MITKAQSKPIEGGFTPSRKPVLSAMERGFLRWSMAETGDKVLDASVGGGLLLEALQRDRDCEVCGVSDDMECVKTARARLSGADIVYAAGGEIPWRENAFDAVFLRPAAQSEGVRARALAETMRVLKPGGQLLLGIRWAPAPILRILRLLLGEEDASRAALYRDRAGVLRELAECGFTQVSWQNVDCTRGVAVGWKPMEMGQ